MLEKIIVFPDIHGRTFWKEPFNNHKNDEHFKFIFLGDYLDPYGFEGIDHKMAWDNFNDMFNSMRQIPDDRQIWLIGNHDMHYFEYFWNSWGCRRDNNYLELMNEVLNKNEKFKIAHEETIHGKKYLFTHAGVHPFYAQRLCNFMNIEEDEPFKASFLNNLYDSGKFSWLWQVSWERGGDYQVGSCIWADVREHIETEEQDNDIYQRLNIYQVFGHSLSYPDLNSYYISDNYAMLDCGKAFVIDVKTGNIETYEDFSKQKQ